MSRRIRLAPVFDERTGDPTLDALARRDNRILRRMARSIRIRTSHGRRRKKFLYAVEGHRYMQVINAAARVAHERRYGVDGPGRPMGREVVRPEVAPVPSPRGLLSR
jgi:hypothetical protein